MYICTLDSHTPLDGASAFVQSMAYRTTVIARVISNVNSNAIANTICSAIRYLHAIATVNSNVIANVMGNTICKCEFYVQCECDMHFSFERRQHWDQRGKWLWLLDSGSGFIGDLESLVKPNYSHDALKNFLAI